MGVGRFLRCFEAVDGEVVGFDTQVQQIPVESADLDAAAGCVFESGDDAAAHGVFKPR